jgi:hypothetical protein
MKKIAVFSLLSMAITFILFSFEIPGETQIPQKCKDEADQTVGFNPKAITLTPLNVRSYYPRILC